jgi:ribose transport system permease protein
MATNGERLESVTARAQQQVAPRAPTRAKRSRNSLAQRGAMLVVLAVVFAVFSFVLPQTFPTAGNVRVMLDSDSVIFIMAVGVTFTLRLGDLDLSFAAVMSFANGLLAILTVQMGWPVPVAMIATVIMGLAVGAVNAVMVVYLRLNSFIATLGTQTALLGLTYGITSSQVIVGLPSAVLSFTRTQLFGLPIDIYYGWILAALVWVCYEFTTYGRYLLFVGGNATAARLAGIRVDRVRATAYIVSGGIFAFAGIVLTGSAGSADPSVGLQYLLPPLAGAFLGTTAIQLGRFNIVGTAVGVYLLLIISTGLELLGAASWVADVFNGVALVVAIGFARFASGSRTRA